MQNIDAVVRAIQADLTPQFEERLREQLATADREWLIDQIVRLTLDAHSLAEIDRKVERDAKARARAERIERVKAIALTHESLAAFTAEHAAVSRESLQASAWSR